MFKGEALKSILVFTAVLSFCMLSMPMASTGQAQDISEESVKQVVEYKLAKKQIADGNNIQVEVEGTTIILTGTVATAEDKRRAGEAARSFDEDYSVDNRLKVDISDMNENQKAYKIAENIRNHVFYNIFDWITVTVKDSTAVLDGWVNDPWYKDQFKKEAMKVPGITTVIDSVKQLPVSSRDDQIRRRAARLIYNDPRLDNYVYRADPPIHIIVKNGVITLMGYVENPGDKSWITNQLLVHTDAVEVNNNLKVVVAEEGS
jgi:osmotically-inducible protein OsmY